MSLQYFLYLNNNHSIKCGLSILILRNDIKKTIFQKSFILPVICNSQNQKQELLIFFSITECSNSWKTSFFLYPLKVNNLKSLGFLESTIIELIGTSILSINN